MPLMSALENIVSVPPSFLFLNLSSCIPSTTESPPFVDAKAETSFVLYSAQAPCVQVHHIAETPNLHLKLP